MPVVGVLTLVPRAKIVDRICLIVRSRSSTAACSRLCRLGLADHPCRSLEGQADREQLLDHGVVEVHRDPVTVLEDGELLQPDVQPGVVDRHAGRAGQRHRQLLVAFAELIGGLLVGEVEVPEHLAVHRDRNAEERPHRRVIRREAVARRVLGEVGEAQRAGVGDQQAEDPVPLGPLADRPVRVVVEPGDEELVEAVSRHVGHAEGAVAGVDELARGVDDALQGRGEVEVRPDGHHGVDELVQPGAPDGIARGHGPMLREGRDLPQELGDDRGRALGLLELREVAGAVDHLEASVGGWPPPERVAVGRVDEAGPARPRRGAWAPSPGRAVCPVPCPANGQMNCRMLAMVIAGAEQRFGVRRIRRRHQRRQRTLAGSASTRPGI